MSLSPLSPRHDAQPASHTRHPSGHFVTPRAGQGTEPWARQAGRPPPAGWGRVLSASRGMEEGRCQTPGVSPRLPKSPPPFAFKAAPCPVSAAAQGLFLPPRCVEASQPLHLQPAGGSPAAPRPRRAVQEDRTRSRRASPRRYAPPRPRQSCLQGRFQRGRFLPGVPGLFSAGVWQGRAPRRAGSERAAPALLTHPFAAGLERKTT